jgi:hypothetical protein
MSLLTMSQDFKDNFCRRHCANFLTKECRVIQCHSKNAEVVGCNFEPQYNKEHNELKSNRYIRAKIR